MTESGYVFVRHESADAFLGRAETWLLGREAENNLILSLSYARRSGGNVEPDALFATLEAGGAVVGCVMRTPPHKLLVSELPLEAAAVVAEGVSAIYERIPTVLGPEAVAEAVANAWVEVRGAAARRGMAQRIYRLDRVIPPQPVEGRSRGASPEDLPLLFEWGEGFGRDVGPAFAPTEAGIRRMVERGDTYVWEAAGRAVSMTVAQGPTPHGCRIGFVYTPPAERGRGYASALVADVSQRMLDSGLDFCVLYTDLSNPTSNAIYQRIGYRALADVVDVEIV